MKSKAKDAIRPVVDAILRLDARLTRRLPLSAMAFGALLALVTAIYNLTGGALLNLNDIGGWANRLLFNAMAGFAHLSLLWVTALLCRKGTARAVLRQLLVTAGFLILLQGINQKTYVYVRNVQPIVRAMDETGLAAAAKAQTNLSAPALTLLYLISRGPVYDMYTVKLFAIACDLMLALFAARAAEEWAPQERKGDGLRPEAALLLCVILPQGFLSTGCAAEFETACMLLLALSFSLVTGCFGVDKHPLVGMLCYASAVALSGVALYALPFFVWLAAKGTMKAAHLACAAAWVVLLCVPAAVSGMGVSAAAASLVRANMGTQSFASGAPSLLDFVPRAAVEEMPGYFVLQRIPELDLEAGAQPFYTQTHMRIAMRSLTLIALALLLCVWTAVLRGKRMSRLRRLLALALGALFLCPNATSSAWLAVDMLCALALVLEPGLRVPACMTLFATTCACAYPVTGESMLTPILSALLCGAALAWIFGLLGQDVAVHGVRRDGAHG